MTIKKIEPQSMAELLASQEKPLVSLRRRQQVPGTVLKISPHEIILDLGSKAEGIVSGKDVENFEGIETLKVGDTIPVTIVQTDTDNNYVVCSLQTFQDTRKLSTLRDSFDSEETIEVRIIEERKGGFLVNYNGIRGFLPASQVSLSYIGKPKELINKNFQVKVLEFDREMPRLIVSQKAVVTEGLKKLRDEFFAKTAIGDEVEGTVATVLPFGLVVDISGIEGFVHISEIAWERVDDPKTYYKPDDKIKAQVTTIDEKEGKITLSVKRLTESPWLKADKQFATKENVSGVVTKKTPSGYLVKLENGVVGMIHNSKIPEGKEYKEGDEVTCSIESVDVEKKKINLLPVGK